MQFFAEPRDNLRDVTPAVRVPLVESVRDAPIGVRLQVSKSEIFELLFELPDAQSVRQRREYVQGFSSQVASCLFRGVLDSAKSAKLVCQAHQHDSRVLRDRE